jgi:opacity protein-like surface antigen
MTRTFLRLIALAFALAGCSASADTAAAEAGVPRFHQLLDAGKFAEIYEQSSEDLKKTATQQDFVALLEAVHRKLGNTKSSDKQGWNINYHTSGTFVTLTYKTVYAEGEAAEQFVFRMQGKVAALVGYHINSTALILK